MEDKNGHKSENVDAYERGSKLADDIVGLLQGLKGDDILDLEESLKDAFTVKLKDTVSDPEERISKADELTSEIIRIARELT